MSQTHSLDPTALTLILFLAIYLYVRVTVVWIASLSSRYADRNRAPGKSPCDRRLDQTCLTAGPNPTASGHSISDNTNCEHFKY
jgi:hypothetical protein